MSSTTLTYKDKNCHPPKWVPIVILNRDHGLSLIKREGAEDWDTIGWVKDSELESPKLDRTVEGFDISEACVIESKDRIIKKSLGGPIPVNIKGILPS